MADNPDAELAQFVAKYALDPLGYCEVAYPWNEGPLDGQPGPRQWQGSVMKAIRKHLVDPDTRYQPLRLAVASGHGIGKSALISMVSNWAMSCYVDARVVVTANTEQQLLTKTSPEIQKWSRMSVTRPWFKPAAMKISSTMPGHEESWRLDLVTWSEKNTEAFAGLHNLGKIIVVIYDEAAGIADKVWEVTQGALTDEKTIIIWIAFGNPTRNTGRFRECF
ncbi:MAG TPA: terminase, partial [Propionibacteriaceae bacterium]|nr:terminase [Propionibacteriaceae bacterium]